MKQKGFTLIELMIAVAIIGVLAGIAIPAFSDYMQKSRRVDAKTALIEIQQNQAKLRANCTTYAQDLAAANDCGNSEVSFFGQQGDGTGVSENGYYGLVISPMGADGINDSVGYIVTATAVAGKAQSGDINCKYITLTVSAANPNGTMTASSSDTGNPDTTDQCL